MSCHASKVIAVGARPPCRWRAYGNAIGRARHNIQHAFLVRERGSVLLAMRTEAPLEACSQWKIRPDAAGSDERPASRLRGHPLPQAFCLLPSVLSRVPSACMHSVFELSPRDVPPTHRGLPGQSCPKGLRALAVLRPRSVEWLKVIHGCPRALHPSASPSESARGRPQRPNEYVYSPSWPWAVGRG